MQQKNISEENLNKIAEISDSIDNLVHAMNIPMPDEFHLKALKSSLPEKVKELQQVYIDIASENPWE